MRHWPALVPVGFVALALALPVQAGASPVLDANCPEPIDALFHNPGQVSPRMAQTFTAINSGPIASVQIHVAKPGALADWLVQINSVDGTGTPTNNVLAARTVTDASVLPPISGGSTLNATFASPPVLTAGQVYALVVSQPGSDDIFIGERFTNPCSTPGALYSSNSQSAPFSVVGVGTADIVFAVFVDVEPPAGDSAAPETTITKGPKSKTKKRSATFEFGSNEAGSFACSLDGGPFEPCSPPKTYDKLKRKKHSFAVTATDPSGNVDPSPATFDWKVKKKQRVR